MANPVEQLKQTPANPQPVTPAEFRRKGETSSNTLNELSTVAELPIDVPVRVKSGRSNPFTLVVPAFEKLATNGTADDTETLSLSHSIVDSPNAESAVVYLDGDRYGAPDAIDYTNDTIDVTDSGTDSDVYVWYTSDAPAQFTVEKSIPDAKVSLAEELYSQQLRRINTKDQAEDREWFDASGWTPYLAGNMTLRIRVDAPYTVRFSDPDGYGHTPSNLVFDFPTSKASQRVPGLINVIKSQMGR